MLIPGTLPTDVSRHGALHIDPGAATVPELKDIAEQLNIDIPRGALKPEVLRTIDYHLRNIATSTNGDPLTKLEMIMAFDNARRHKQTKPTKQAKLEKKRKRKHVSITGTRGIGGSGMGAHQGFRRWGE